MLRLKTGHGNYQEPLRLDLRREHELIMSDVAVELLSCCPWFGAEATRPELLPNQGLDVRHADDDFHIQKRTTNDNVEIVAFGKIVRLACRMIMLAKHY